MRLLALPVGSELLIVFALPFILSSGCVGSATPRNTHAQRDYYPTEAKLRGLTGRVGVEYTCDEKGRAQNIVVVESAGPLLDAAAKTLLSDGHCTPGNPPAIRGRT